MSYDRRRSGDYHPAACTCVDCVKDRLNARRSGAAEHIAKAPREAVREEPTREAVRPPEPALPTERAEPGLPHTGRLDCLCSKCLARMSGTNRQPAGRDSTNKFSVPATPKRWALEV